MSTVGRSLPHDSAVGHTTGEARFIDDIPPLRGELYVDFAGSPAACGRLEGIDIDRALAIEGVIGVFTHADVPGANCFGPIFVDEPFLPAERVSYHGQPVAVVAATSPEAARAAREAVRILVRPEPAVLSIEEARGREEFLGPPRVIARGDFAAAWSSAPHHIEGEFHSAGQEQFYLESQAAIAYPGEDGAVLVHASTQNPTELQLVVAEVLGLGMHQVVCVCKRMGGAFGGKETQAALPGAMVALVASKTGRAARIIYTKDDDMAVTGKRHPYSTRYQVAFDETGRILGAKLDFFSDGGSAADLSTSVMERTLLHADNAYFLPHVELSGRVCRTNFPPNTAFRGFGGPQAVAAIENILEEIACRLRIDALAVRRRNCYGKTERNVTPYGQIVKNHQLPEIFERLAETSDYSARRKRIDELNAASRTQLRGLAMTAVKFGISFTTRFLNQGNALVNVYTDGTVQVSTGATEMGQGVHTKIRQLVADEFGLDVERVRVMITSTEKNNNTSPTAASASTDLNGAAALNACRQIKERLIALAADQFADPASGLARSPEHVCFEGGNVFDERSPERASTFRELAHHARQERVDLGARGFYRTPGVDFNRETGRGHPFYYYTTGCAVSEVCVDRFTGEVRVERVDLLMDVGRRINPGIDDGQVIGGFVQGMGWATTESLRYDAEGRLLSYSPTTYKIPGVHDVPHAFQMDFLETAHPQNVGSSKAVGEPPLLLGVSVWAAIKNALSYARPGTAPDLDLPATGERVLLALQALEEGPGVGADGELKVEG